MINKYPSFNPCENTNFSLLEKEAHPSSQGLPQEIISHVLGNVQPIFLTLNQTFTSINETIDEFGDASPYVKSVLKIGIVFLGIELLQAGIKGFKHLRTHKEILPLYTAKGMQLATTLFVNDLPLVKAHFALGHPHSQTV